MTKAKMHATILEQRKTLNRLQGVGNDRDAARRLLYALFKQSPRQVADMMVRAHAELWEDAMKREAKARQREWGVHDTMKKLGNRIKELESELAERSAEGQSQTGSERENDAEKEDRRTNERQLD